MAIASSRNEQLLIQTTRCRSFRTSSCVLDQPTQMKIVFPLNSCIFSISRNNSLWDEASMIVAKLLWVKVITKWLIHRTSAVVEKVPNCHT